MAPELTDEVTDKLEQLGPPSAEFKMDLNLLDIVIYGIARALFGAGLLAVGGWMLFVLLAEQRGGKAMGLAVVLLVAGMAIFLQGLAASIRLWRRRRLRMLVFPDGLVALQGGSGKAVRWDRVRALVQGARRRDLYPKSIGGSIRASIRRSQNPEGRSYILIRKDDLHVRLGSRLPGIKELWAIVQQESLKALLPDSLASLARGENLYFGTLRADREGIHKGADCLPWSGVKEIKIDELGQLVIRTAAYTWLSDAAAEYPNIHLLQALAEHERGEKPAALVDASMLQDVATHARVEREEPSVGSAIPQGLASQVVDEVFEEGYVPPSSDKKTDSQT